MIATFTTAGFSELFMSYLLARKSNRRGLIDQLFNSSEKRLAGFSFSANFGKEGRPEPIVGVQSGNAGGDDRHDPVAGELFHEQIPNWASSNTTDSWKSTLVERGFVRQARDRNEGCGHSRLASFIRMIIPGWN